MASALNLQIYWRRRKVNLVLAARRQEPMEKLASDLRRKYGVDVLVEAIDLASPGAAWPPEKQS